MSKHTPGPWKVLNNVQIHDEKLGGVIAVCCRYASYDAVDHANANLIAAAPHLLEALEGMMNAIDCDDLVARDGRIGSDGGDHVYRVTERAKAAIAKARAK